MLPTLQQAFDAIEEQRDALQGDARALSDASLNWKPDIDTWSVRQIVEHLVLSDETVGQAAEPVLTESLMFRVLPRTLRFRLVLSALDKNQMLPLPSPGVEPAGNVPLPTLLERWQAARDEMRRALDGEPVYFHPVLGPLSPAQMLQLSHTHMAYHLRQLQALRGLPAFPA